MFKGTLIGNLGADAEFRSENGSEFVSFKVADSRKWKDTTGNEHEETTWVSCTINGKAENLFPYLKQGAKVVVIGRLSFNVYSSKKDRCMKAGVKMFVESVELIGAQPDAVPRQLVDQNGEIINVFKAFYIPNDIQKARKYAQLMDLRSNVYVVDKVGFVSPQPVDKVDSSAEV